ncbi:50S ribosomal protein L18 [bacterium]|nr:50S ribosomal protein L18 [bacterium]
MLEKQVKRKRRHKRLRAKISGTKERPRLCVFRSNKHIYAQLIDDKEGKTLLAASDLEVKSKIKKKKGAKLLNERKQKTKKEENRTGKVAIAYEVGRLIAEKALKKKIEKVVFDRGGYKYHGRVKALAEGAREGGLIF